MIDRAILGLAISNKNINIIFLALCFMTTKGKTLTIVTHSGAFHLDDVLACFMLRKIYPNAEIVRSREKAVIDSADIVVDVGGVFDPTQHRYDHHQRGFEETYNAHYDIKLSSAGLVYKYYAMQFIKSLGFTFDDTADELLFVSTLYDVYFVSVDANDNGVDVADPVRFNQRTLDDMVKAFVPHEVPKDQSVAEEMRYVAFLEAMEYMGADLIRQCKKLEFDIKNNGLHIRSAFETMTSNKNRYIFMPEGSPSKELIKYYNMHFGRKVAIVIYTRETKQGKSYSILCLPKDGVKYTPEIPLCKEWRGLRDADLCALPGMKDANFVHATGFCGAAYNSDTAIYMAVESIKEHEQSKESLQ